MAEQYPEAASGIIDKTSELFKIYSVTHNVIFYFLPYNFKMTENFNISWNQQSVIGRMDPIATFKNMGRNLTVSFQARQKLQDGRTPLSFTPDELLHSIDHLKKCLYPKYESVTQAMTSPPLFRIQYKNLINAGQNQFEVGPANGVLGYMTSFAANFVSDPNKIYHRGELAYPKIFDIEFTFAVLNEQLVETQTSGITNSEYFYKYGHKHATHKGVNVDPVIPVGSSDEASPVASITPTSAISAASAPAAAATSTTTTVTTTAAAPAMTEAQTQVVLNSGVFSGTSKTTAADVKAIFEGGSAARDALKGTR
jgi:hypothetical protein